MTVDIVSEAQQEAYKHILPNSRCPPNVHQTKIAWRWWPSSDQICYEKRKFRIQEATGTCSEDELDVEVEGGGLCVKFICICSMN